MSPARAWLVPVGALRRHSGSAREVEIHAPLPGMAITYARVPDESAVSFKGKVTSTVGGVVVDGTAQARYEGECRRCLEEASGELVVAVREVCLDHPDPELGYGVEPDWLDLEPIVHDACILELPLAPLCREACQGLCPECGVNRNNEACSCAVRLEHNGSDVAT
ncbi:MAG: YceD family protein [Acidimicrobiales bacterium]